ncbi:MAG TPA: thioesterase family protein [Pyrinomonadaceae bacterium]|nr:thioesterase family protein [Pyrinomonadaceae bacterium]
MSESAITYRGTVYPWQCDHMGHMNVMWYAAKFDEASWQFLATLGLTASYFREQGVGMVAIEQHTEYKRELLAGDTVTIRSTVNDLKDKTLRLIHEMKNEQTGQIAALTTIVGLHIDTTSRRSLRLPEHARARAVRVISRSADSACAPLDYQSDSSSFSERRELPFY